MGLRDEPVELDQTTLVTLGAGLASLGGYLTGQVTKFRSRKLEFLATLAHSLYFRNLDNDVGVLHHLVDAAEEEEVKEALLAWVFLRAHGALAMAELVDLRLVDTDEAGHLRAVPASAGLQRLDERWDDYFTYHAPPISRR